MATRRQCYVEFYSPGTFVSECTTKPIATWNRREACQLAKEVIERYGAKPYAFRFTTCIVADPVSDGQGGELKVIPKEVEESGLKFLGGRVLSYDQICQRNDPKEKILRSNMECNRQWFICINDNSWRSTMPFDEADEVVDPDTGDVLERGDTSERKQYRDRMTKQRDAELAARTGG